MLRFHFFHDRSNLMRHDLRRPASIVIGCSRDKTAVIIFRIAWGRYEIAARADIWYLPACYFTRLANQDASLFVMMTSWHGNAFRIIGPVRRGSLVTGEGFTFQRGSIGYGWIPLTKGLIIWSYVFFRFLAELVVINNRSICGYMRRLNAHVTSS